MSVADEAIGYLETRFAHQDRTLLDPESRYIGPIFQLKTDNDDCMPMDVGETDYQDSQRWWL